MIHSPSIETPNPNRLLVLDDDPAILSLVRRMGEHIGYKTCGVSVFDSFKDQYHELQPTVVLLDLILQREDALRVVEFMGRERFSGGLILFSGYDYRILRSIAEVARGHGLNVMGTVEKGRNMQKVPAILRTTYLGGLPPALTAVS
jgi:PleD family two-component response regulator